MPRAHLAALCLTLLGGTACARDFSAPPGLASLLERADAALAAGESLGAQAAYEQAAALQHAARIEVGWVRARMQAGGYRQAVAFAAHAAGAHPEEAHGALLYAHLLNAGGQTQAAHSVLSRARERLPGEPLLQAPLSSCPSHRSGVPDELQLPSLGEPLPPGLVVAGSALLLDDGQHALVPLAMADEQTPLWVRNGLGRTQAARMVSRDVAAGTAVLALAAPLDTPATLSRAPREAFPGSPAFVTGYAASAHAKPAWPQLCAGFLGTPPPDGGPRPLGIAIEAGSVGAPVFDSAGRLIGLVGPIGPTGTPTLLSARNVTSIPTSNDTSPRPLDEVYERSLRSSLQLIRRPLAMRTNETQAPPR
ncbi:serine protease [Piscinibacter sp. HJYY11]|uniref:S1 family peptidase n=1 Tax=Piscinibacter sp. HJYY11 TaxID=2801333 RepID=UPI001F31C84D|nr:serine protease [Piscinibacter sp. HJYY11]